MDKPEQGGYMTTTKKVLRRKLSLLQLATELCNVRQACRGGLAKDSRVGALKVA